MIRYHRITRFQSKETTASSTSSPNQHNVSHHGSATIEHDHPLRAFLVHDSVSALPTSDRIASFDFVLRVTFSACIHQRSWWWWLLLLGWTLLHCVVVVVVVV